jgi:hypothetical protein
MNQPASSPVNFTTSATLTGLVANSFAGEKGYKEWIGTISVDGTNAATGTTFYNTMGVSPTVTTVTGGNINGAPATVYTKVDFAGVVTSGNIANNSVVGITAGSQGSLNSTTMPRVDTGTLEERGSFVISTWANTTSIGSVQNKFLVSIKFFA